MGFTSSNRQFHLNVYLSSSFPTDKPILHVTPSINHQWVDGTTGEIQNAPGLLNVNIFFQLKALNLIVNPFETAVHNPFGFGSSGARDYKRI